MSAVRCAFVSDGGGRDGSGSNGAGDVLVIVAVVMWC